MRSEKPLSLVAFTPFDSRRGAGGEVPPLRLLGHSQLFAPSVSLDGALP